MRERHLHMLEAALRRTEPLGRPLLLPGQVVKWPGRIGDAPMNHGACGVGLEGPHEALDALVVIEAVAPVEADIEPALRLWRRGRDTAPVRTEVEAIHGSSLTDIVPRVNRSA